MVSRSPWARAGRLVAATLLMVATAGVALPRSGLAQARSPEWPCPPPLQAQPTAWRIEGHEQLNSMRATIAGALKAVEVQAPGVSGDILGFRAGADYGLVYARDSATIAPAAQFLYDLPYLTRPAEEFLHLQFDGEPGDPEDAAWLKPAQPGALSGVIGGEEPAPIKMLVTSDEETSVVHMAYVAFKARAGLNWLLDLQAGKPRIQRLNEGIEWLFAQRFDPQLGLIKRGHTTDWGDVEVNVGNAAWRIPPEPKEWTASIYDQAWTYRALLELAEMNEAVDQPRQAEAQRARARILRQSSAERLWQPDRGFFRTHIHIPPVRHAFDEDRIVSIANAVAVYTGLAAPSERGPIFRALEEARIAAGATKPGLALYPPYPQGFFDYPQMAPGRYQNGAVWDWWGGIQISAEFWNGHARLARQHLDLVAADWARAAGEVFEWQEPRSRRNGGSPAYAGAAATIAEAIVGGLLGVELGPSGWTAAPRLGAESGGIHVHHPPSGCWLTYWQTYAGDRLALEWETNHPVAGRLRVLVPADVIVTGALLDQIAAPLAVETLGEDTYVAPRAAPGPGKHRLELQLARQR